MKKFFYNILLLCGLSVTAAVGLVACSDEPDSDNYVTFTGEMMSEFLLSNENYSDFAQIVKKAGLMDQLSAYGHYTCFVPTNSAVAEFLSQKKKTMETLTVEDCDTIARTHILDALYSTFDMTDGVLPTQNMMRRPLEISHSQDENENSVVILNKKAMVFFATQNDSVENGIVHPIDMVLESSTSMLPDLIKINPTVSIYYKALHETGIDRQMMLYKDDNYITGILSKYEGEKRFKDYKSGAEPLEYATPPDDHLYGFTAFLVPDEILEHKYGIHNIEELHAKACEIYGNDAGTELTDPENSLYKFMAYHVLDRKVKGCRYLTVQAEQGTNFEDFGFVRTILNPNDWYGTLLPYSTIKVERLTATIGEDGIQNDWYLNRRSDNKKYFVLGSHIHSTVEDYDNQALNGIYLYVDDILKYDDDTKDIVLNCRMRRDMSSVFPELMTNDIRMNGNIAQTGEPVDHTVHPYGRNYFFPNGYLDGVTVGGNGYFIYRRPRQGYWSLHGDEFICQGDYDVTFRIPSVPFTSEWQVRLGYAAMVGVRGVAQIYFGDDPDNLQPQGIPLDMNRDLRVILGGSTSFNIPEYGDMSDEDKLEERKTLKNKGYYRGCNGGFRSGGTDQERFARIYATIRIVLCTYHMEPGKDYYLRIRAVSSKSGNDNEAMLDYLELVPKSVWGVVDGEEQEDDL